MKSLFTISSGEKSRVPFGMDGIIILNIKDKSKKIKGKISETR
jgi:hypothetical protein